MLAFVEAGLQTRLIVARRLLPAGLKTRRYRLWKAGIAHEVPMSAHSSFPTVASSLLQTIDAALPRLRSMKESQAASPRAPGKWSPKQVIGHLIDSAANNHQRFVRAQEVSSLALPGYAQDHWVGCQHYQDRSWDDLTGLWHAYNRHLAHVIGRIPESCRQVSCTIGASAPVTLEFLAEDYLAHLRHHLAQVGIGA